MALTINLTITGDTPVLHDKPYTPVGGETDAQLADYRTHKDYATDTNPVFLRERFLEILRRAGETINVSGSGGNKVTNSNRSLVLAACRISATVRRFDRAAVPVDARRRTGGQQAASDHRASGELVRPE